MKGVNILKDNDPNIVLIGGGTGLSYVLKGLKKYPVNITAIITVSDNGGSSGEIRSMIQMVPPGDIRKVMVALSEAEPLLNQLLDYRFTDDNTLFANHTVGNIILTALYYINDGDYIKAIKQLSKVLNVRGKVLPVATQPVTLVAKMSDGSIVVGEQEIRADRSTIEEITLLEKDRVSTTEEVLEAIEEANLIVFGPGSLYTSIIPNLLIPQVKEAILASKAEKLYVCNVMTEPGETDGMMVSDHIQTLEKYLAPGVIDAILANDDYQVADDVMAIYEKTGAELVKVDLDQVARLGKELITSRFIYVNEKKHIRHNSIKIAAYIVMKLLEEFK